LEQSVLDLKGDCLRSKKLPIPGPRPRRPRSKTSTLLTCTAFCTCLGSCRTMLLGWCGRNEIGGRIGLQGQQHIFHTRLARRPPVFRSGPAPGPHSRQRPVPALCHTEHLGPWKTRAPPPPVRGLRQHCQRGLPAGWPLPRNKPPSPSLAPVRRKQLLGGTAPVTCRAAQALPRRYGGSVQLSANDSRAARSQPQGFCKGRRGSSGRRSLRTGVPPEAKAGYAKLQ